jgi:S1-C subfamily serine protease
VLFGVVRGGELVEVPVVIGRVQGGNRAYVNRDAEGQQQSRPSMMVPVEEKEASLERTYYFDGVELTLLDDSFRDQLGLTEAYEGTVVIQVNPRSKAAKRGLQVGDVIVEVGRKRITSTRGAYRADEKLTGDVVVLGIIRNGKKQFVMMPKM